MQHQNIVQVEDIANELEELRQRHEDGELSEDEAYDFEQLQDFMSKLEGTGGDFKWEGCWYPSHIIHSDYFTEYAEELARDCGMVDDNAKWPYTCIDWDVAAEELKHDYSVVQFENHTYYAR